MARKSKNESVEGRGVRLLSCDRPRVLGVAGDRDRLAAAGALAISVALGHGGKLRTEAEAKGAWCGEKQQDRTEQNEELPCEKRGAAVHADAHPHLHLHDLRSGK